MDVGMSDLVRQVVPKEEIRFRYANEQEWDKSCGYAALASLLGRYRGLEVDEARLLALSSSEGEAVVSVSLGRLVRLTQAMGLRARAGRADYQGLVERLSLSAPLLVHYDRPQGHFALVLAAGPDGVVTVDPARGLELLTKAQFEGRWSGAVLDVADPREGPNAEVDEAVQAARSKARLVDRALSKGPPKR